MPKPVAAPAFLGFLGLLGLAAIPLEAPLWERVASGLLGGALLLSAFGVRARHSWAWWLAVVSLILQAAWGVQSAVAGQEDVPGAFILGITFVFSGSALMLLGSRRVQPSGHPASLPSQRLVPVIGGGLLIAGVVSIAFELEAGVLPATLAAVLGLSALYAWRRRPPPAVAQDDATQDTPRRRTLSP